MKLYSFSPTPNNRKVEAFIKHYDLPVEIHSMSFKAQENRSPEYLAMNPMGKAPLLEDGDFSLWESNAIMVYLATQFAPAGNLPADPQGRADVDRWLYWQAFHWINMIIAFRDDPEAAADDVALNMSLLNGQLEGNEFIRGELGIVDFAVAPYALGRHGQAIDYSDYPNVRAWLDRCNELKGIVETVWKPPQKS